MTEPKEPPSLDALKAEIARVRQASSPKDAGRNPTDNAAIGHIIDLFSGFIVGGGIGYVLDRQFATLPVFLVVGMLLGAASGFFMIYKSVSRPDAAVAEDEKKSQ